MINYSQVGEIVKAYRKAQGLNQKDFANIVKVSERTVLTVEKGNKVDIETIGKVLKPTGWEIVAKIQKKSAK